MRKIYPNQSLDADQQFILSLPCFRESYIIHSYSDSPQNLTCFFHLLFGNIADASKQNDQTDAGAQWYNLPKTIITPQLKRDLQMIELRSVLDPHRHYKKNNRKGKIPTFSQVGTVIEGPTEFYSSRINKKDRSKNFVEEAMKSENQTGRFKRKYEEIQGAKTSGKKAHYKKLMQKRQKKS